MACRLGGAGSLRLLLLVVPGQAYPAHHAPRIKAAREAALISVARHQHDDAPLVDVFEVHGGGGPQVAGKRLGGLEHDLLADPRLGDRAAFRGGRPLPGPPGPPPPPPPPTPP